MTLCVGVTGEQIGCNEQVLYILVIRMKVNTHSVSPNYVPATEYGIRTYT